MPLHRRSRAFDDDAARHHQPPSLASYTCLAPRCFTVGPQWRIFWFSVIPSLSLDHAGFMQHRGPAGAVAENVAMGCATEACARRMWMQSPPHRANMMRGGCQAVASAVSASGRRYWAMEIGGCSCPSCWYRSSSCHPHRQRSRWSLGTSPLMEVTPREDSRTTITYSKRVLPRLCRNRLETENFNDVSRSFPLSSARAFKKDISSNGSGAAALVKLR
jgi:hypothetical protein